MGTTSWVVAGLLAFLLAQSLPWARSARKWKEAALALSTSLAGGMAATALDFGGWKALEWRAAAFAFFTALAALGVLRFIRRPVDV